MGLMLVLVFGAMFTLSMAPTTADIRAAQTIIDVSRIKPGEMRVIYPERHGAYGSSGHWNALIIVHRTPEQIDWLQSHQRPDTLIRETGLLFLRNMKSQELDPALRSLRQDYLVVEPVWWEKDQHGYLLAEGISTGAHEHCRQAWLENGEYTVEEKDSALGSIHFTTIPNAVIPNDWCFDFDLAGRPIGYRYVNTLAVPEHHYDSAGLLVVGPSDDDSAEARVRRFISKYLI